MQPLSTKREVILSFPSPYFIPFTLKINFQTIRLDGLYSHSLIHSQPSGTDGGQVSACDPVGIACQAESIEASRIGQFFQVDNFAALRIAQCEMNRISQR